MSPTDAELGRAIVALQCLYSGASWRSSGNRRFPDDQIQRLFGITPAKMDRCLTAYNKTRPRSWTQREVAEAILKFAVKNGRWPKRRDMESWRENGLPSKDVFHRNYPPRYGSSFNNTSAESSMDVCIRSLIEVRALWNKFTPQLILAIRNVTVRQQAMEKYGIQKLLKDLKAKAFQQDDFGKLWRLPTDNKVDPHAQWVEVENATPEKNGRRLHFFLRVPPNFNTAREAVHWTFPALETEGITPEKLNIAKAS